MFDTGIAQDLQAKIYEALLRATTEGTRNSYGAGLLRFHQFCDRHSIPEHVHLPADHLWDARIELSAKQHGLSLDIDSLSSEDDD